MADDRQDTKYMRTGPYVYKKVMALNFESFEDELEELGGDSFRNRVILMTYSWEGFHGKEDD